MESAREALLASLASLAASPAAAPSATARRAVALPLHAHPVLRRSAWAWVAASRDVGGGGGGGGLVHVLPQLVAGAPFPSDGLDGAAMRQALPPSLACALLAAQAVGVGAGRRPPDNKRRRQQAPAPTGPMLWWGNALFLLLLALGDDEDASVVGTSSLAASRSEDWLAPLLAALDLAVVGAIGGGGGGGMDVAAVASNAEACGVITDPQGKRWSPSKLRSIPATLTRDSEQPFPHPPTPPTPPSPPPRRRRPRTGRLGRAGGGRSTRPARPWW